MIYDARAMDVLEIFREAFPAGSDRVRLELVEAAVQDERSLVLTVRLVVWDANEDGSLSIRDVKEQQIWGGAIAELASAPRLAECVEGWRMAVEQVFSQDDLEFADTLMPADLLPNFTLLLALKRPRTADDFAEALLTSKQRLGRFLRS